MLCITSVFTSSLAFILHGLKVVTHFLWTANYFSGILYVLIFKLPIRCSNKAPVRIVLYKCSSMDTGTRRNSGACRSSLSVRLLVFVEVVRWIQVFVRIVR